MENLFPSSSGFFHWKISNVIDQSLYVTYPFYFTAFSTISLFCTFGFSAVIDVGVSCLILYYFVLYTSHPLMSISILIFGKLSFKILLNILLLTFLMSLYFFLNIIHTFYLFLGVQIISLLCSWIYFNLFFFDGIIHFLHIKWLTNPKKNSFVCENMLYFLYFKKEDHLI